MLVAIFGESCTGKSTLAGMLKERLGGDDGQPRVQTC